MPITVIERAIVWEASADDASGHACEPRIVRRANGEILLAHRLGTRRESDDGRPHLLRSGDRGRTWESLGQPLDGLGQEGWDLRGTALAELPSGELLTVVVALDKSLDRPTYNPETEGLIPVANPVADSSDGGRTWQRLPDLHGGPVPQTASQGLLVLPGGDVLCTFETFKEYDEPGPWRYLGGLLRSHDGGRPWGDCVISAASDPDGDPHDTMWWDPRIARLPQANSSNSPTPSGIGPAPRARSTRCGAATTAGRGRRPPRPGWSARPPTRSPLDDGRLVVLEQRRGDEQTVVAHAQPGWRPHIRRCRRDRRLSSRDHLGPGADGALSAFDYLMSMDQFTFGHPCGVATGPDEVMAIWYAGGATRTAIHSAHLRID